MLISRHRDDTVVEITKHSTTTIKKIVQPQQINARQAWRKDIILIVSTSLLFLAILFCLHITHSLSSSHRPLRNRSVSSSSLHTSSSPSTLSPAAASDTPDLSTVGAPLQRHILSTSENVTAASPSANSTPASRARAKNPWSPFRSAEDKIKRFQRWEIDFQVLLDKHRDARKALHEWLSPAVNVLGLHASPLHKTDKCVAFLDGRTDPLFIFLLKHMFHLLGPDWGLVIFHTTSNQDWWIDQLEIRPGAPGEHIDMQRVDPIRFQQANSLATSPEFYLRIPCETILLVQPDTMMLRSEYWPNALGPNPDAEGPTLSSLLARYIYLGAPWPWCDGEWCRGGGNGGLSMRKRSAMLDLVRELRCTDWECHWMSMFEHFSHQQEIKWKHVEDTFFAYQIHDHRYKYGGEENQVATPAEHAWFAFESMEWSHVTSPWFVHKIWNYMSHLRYGPMMAKTMQYYPELWMTKEELEGYNKEIQT